MMKKEYVVLLGYQRHHGNLIHKTDEFLNRVTEVNLFRAGKFKKIQLSGTSIMIKIGYHSKFL